MGMRQIRKAVTDTLRFEKPEFELYSTVPPVPVLPAAVVIPSDDTTATRETTGGSWLYFIDVYVMMAYNEMESAQDDLDDELDPKKPGSVMAVLTKNSTLRKAVMDSTPMAIANYGPAEAGEAGGVSFIGAQIRLEIREC